MDTRNNSPMSRFNKGGGGNYNNNLPPRDKTISQVKTISPAKEVKFFRDEKKEKLDPDVFYDTAEKKADEIIQTKQLNSAQLRRFFGEMKGYYQQWKNQEKSDKEFEKIFPFIKLMKSKVYYACKPPKAKIPEVFASFLLGGIEQIKDSRDFEAFILYFEAVVGFLYGKGLR
jgi:CRISPR type III-A-associated protein Csm2